MKKHLFCFVAALAVACATSRPLDTASDAYTALYTLMAETASTEEDFARLGRMEACWRTLYAWAEGAVRDGRDTGAVRAVLAAFLADAGGGDCLGVPHLTPVEATP